MTDRTKSCTQIVKTTNATCVNFITKVIAMYFPVTMTTTKLIIWKHWEKMKVSLIPSVERTEPWAYSDIIF